MLITESVVAYLQDAWRDGKVREQGANQTREWMGGGTQVEKFQQLAVTAASDFEIGIRNFCFVPANG